MKTQKEQIQDLSQMIDDADKASDKIYRAKKQDVKELMEEYFKSILVGEVYLEGGLETWTFRNSAGGFRGEYGSLYLETDWDYDNSQPRKKRLVFSTSSFREHDVNEMKKVIGAGRIAMVLQEFSTIIVSKIMGIDSRYRDELRAISKGKYAAESQRKEINDSIRAQKIEDFKERLHVGVRVDSVEVEKRYNQIYSRVLGIKIVEFNKSGKRVTLQITQKVNQWKEEKGYTEVESDQTIDIQTSKMNDQVNYWLGKEVTAEDKK